MAGPDRQAESRKAGARAKVEHPYLIIKRDFGFTKTRYRGLSKNLNHLHVLFSSPPVGVCFINSVSSVFI